MAPQWHSFTPRAINANPLTGNLLSLHAGAQRAFMHDLHCPKRTLSAILFKLIYL